MKKVLALLAITTSFAAVAEPLAAHTGKAPNKGANSAFGKTQGKAFKGKAVKGKSKGKAAKGKSVAHDAPQTMETAPVAPAPQQAAPATETAPQAPAANSR
nr:hypothetical protein [uncultured Kingella sp.]